MKRPAFLFYPDGWMRNANLRRCSPTARGAWIDTMCLMHDSDEYGLLRWPLADIAQSIGTPLKFVRELVDKGVMKGAERGECKPYIFIPQARGREGDPVELIGAQPGPIWYSSRMLKDEWIRNRQAEIGRANGYKGGEYGALGGRPGGSNKPPSIPPEADGGGVNVSPLSVAVAVAGSSLRSEPLTRLTAGVDDAEKPASADPPPFALNGSPEGPRAGPPDCPAEQVVEMFHEVLPELPRIERLTDTRRAHIRQRWKEWAVEKGWRTRAEGLEEWRRFFVYVRSSEFLMGRSKPREQGKKPFVATLEWLMKPANHVKVFEGNYHD